MFPCVRVCTLVLNRSPSPHPCASLVPPPPGPLNTNKFNLGNLQNNGAAVNDVVLPPWAHGSAHEFVRLHREALESEFVSMNLHHWIDLIFGYKQMGEAAVEAGNVFHPLTYAGHIQLDEIESLEERRAIEVQIV